MAGPLWVGVDDTDSPRGGCTTFTLTEIVETARSLGIDLIGEPRLVRLNPNVPFKTRGNGALAARFGHGVGPSRRQGVGPSGPVLSFARGRPLSPKESETLLEAAWGAVRRTSRLGEAGTDPVLVAVDHALPADLYRDAVCRLVDREAVEQRVVRAGARILSVGDRQGIVGAAAAIAWPARRATWELLSYREARHQGTPRRIDAARVRRLTERFPDLFLCADARTRRLLVSPHTACPILFGLRSRHGEGLARAARGIALEPVERWLVFRTNQGTGDHLVWRPVSSLAPYDAARVRGRVVAPPVDLTGGHVRFRLVDATGPALDCLAFEPTKTLPAVARDLAPGDTVEVWGGLGHDPIFRVEGIRLLSRAPRRGRAVPPDCPACGGRTRSLGRVRGYRCPACGVRQPPEAARWPARPRFPLGVYHPTPSARRHLAPLGPEPHGRTSPGGVGTDLYRP